MGSAMRRARAKFGRPAAHRVLDRSGRRIARYLEGSGGDYEPPISGNPAGLRRSLQPGDVLLVEGTSHISGVIKYLTQSTWSHAALYVGPIRGAILKGEPHVLVEAELGQGVVSSPLSKYDRHHTRICRPIGLSRQDCERVCNYAAERIGFEYDFRNIIDLMRRGEPRILLVVNPPYDVFLKSSPPYGFGGCAASASSLGSVPQPGRLGTIRCPASICGGCVNSSSSQARLSMSISMMRRLGTAAAKCAFIMVHRWP